MQIFLKPSLFRKYSRAVNHKLLPLPIVIIMCFLVSHTFANVTGEENRLG